MKKMIILKRIFIIILVVFSTFCCFLNTSAKEDTTDTTTPECTDEALFKKYGPKYDALGNSMKVYFDVVDEMKAYKSVVFTLKKSVISVGDTTKEVTAPSGLTVSGNNELLIEESTLNKLREGSSYFSLYFEGNESGVKDSLKCSGTITLVLSVNGFGRKVGSSSYDLPASTFTGGSSSGSAIDCSNYDKYKSGSTKDLFKYGFCYSYAMAKSQNTAKDRHVFDFSSENPTELTFSCNKNQLYDSSDLKGEDYYKNAKYLYAKQEIEESLGQYAYTFYPGAEPEPGEELICKKTCEEAVEIKYGPPVVSKAGMCFEYKVKIISRTNCYTEAKFGLPKNYSVCTPYPACYSGGYYVGRSAGPNDNFDDCIKSCDNGKYTKNCSKKCYNAIYGKNKSNKTSSQYYALDTIKLRNPVLDKGYNNCENNGCYFKDTNGTIYWNAKSGNSGSLNSWSKQDSTTYHPGRWYMTTGWGSWGYSSGTTYVVRFNDGFYRALHSGSRAYGEVCDDYCTWNGCSGKVYLNKTNHDSDATKNMKKYDTAKATCTYTSSCSSSVKEVSIDTSKEYDTDVYYDTNDFTNNKSIYTITAGSVKFPVGADYDYITYGKSGFVNSTRGGGNSTLISEDLDYLDKNSPYGCYEESGTKATDRYSVTWGFPGTWINIKTGEISYNGSGKGNNEKKKKKNKFCSKTNASRVNAKWWNYYMYYMKVHNKYPSIKYADFANECDDGTSTTVINPGSLASIDITENIKASTRGFGLFKWSINVNCFYAVNYCKQAYKVRTIDRKNIFPDESGSSLSNSNSVGRTPGFNWSTLSETNKNPDYVLNPMGFVYKTQSEAWNDRDAIYTDANLDYQINLTRSAIDDLRKVKNYTLFKQEFLDADNSVGNVDNRVSNGVPRYYSSVISDLVKEYGGRRPSKRVSECNNIKDSSAAAPVCDDFKEYRNLDG